MHRETESEKKERTQANANIEFPNENIGNANRWAYFSVVSCIWDDMFFMLFFNNSVWRRCDEKKKNLMFARVRTAGIFQFQIKIDAANIFHWSFFFFCSNTNMSVHSVY